MSEPDDRRARECVREVFKALDQAERWINELPEPRRRDDCINVLLQLRRAVTTVLQCGDGHANGPVGGPR